MGAPLSIEPERGRKDRRAFVGLHYRLYRDNPVWVPPLRMAERDLMNRKKNPFFRFATVQHFLARRGSRVVGRIAAIENPRHNEFHEDELGFFGFFDVEPDQEAATGLIAAARAWCESRGRVGMRGPVNYSTNDSCGVLVEGFDASPRLMMPYNRPDYEALLLGAGLVGVKDLLALWIGTDNPVPPRFRRVIDRVLERKGITIRKIVLPDDVPIIKDLYGRCWERNWGFVPPTLEEMDHAAGDLALLVEPVISCIAERNGEPVGFSAFLRDLNLVIKGSKNGRLVPFLWLKLLLRAKKVRATRCILLGVVPEARGMAINEAFFAIALEHGLAGGVTGAEAGWVLEDNEAMLKPILQAGGNIVKRYRMYETPETAE